MNFPLPSPSPSPSLSSLLNEDENQKRLDYFNNAESFFGNDEEEEQVEEEEIVEVVEEEEEEEVEILEEDQKEEEDSEEEEEDMEEVMIDQKQQHQQQTVRTVSPATVPSPKELPSNRLSASSYTAPVASTSTLPLAPKPSGRKRPRIESFPATTPTLPLPTNMTQESIGRTEGFQDGIERGEEDGGEMRPPDNITSNGNGKRRAEEIGDDYEEEGEESRTREAGEENALSREDESRNHLQHHQQPHQNHQQLQEHSSSAPPSSHRSQSGPMEPSIFNVEPLDEFTKHVGDWLWSLLRQANNPEEIEIEAKIGIVLNNRTSSRQTLPVYIESILPDSSECRFESNMTINQHKQYNQLLNSLVESSSRSDYPFSPVRYAHTREIDSFHSNKVRVTRVSRGKGDTEGGKVLNVLKKQRIGDLNIASPKRWFDWRISVNVEEKVPLPTSAPTGMSREKDRITYTHQSFQVDLTQVTTPSTNPKHPQPSVTHELEVEFKNAQELIEEGWKEENGVEGNRYLELVQVFLNNIRMLIRNAADP